MKGLCSKLASLTQEVLDEINSQAGSCIIWQHLLQAGQMVYIPAGSICVMVSKKGPLICGWRKSFFIRSDSFVKNYTVCKDALASSGVDVKRMNEVLQATAEDTPAQ